MQVNQLCISTTFAIMVNESPSSFFKTSRGLRQGDPLSLLLLIAVIEGLNKMLLRVRELELFTGSNVSKGEHMEE